MAEPRYVLCRRTTNDFGSPLTYCAKPIAKSNPMNYCADCWARLPIWPAAVAAR